MGYAVQTCYRLGLITGIVAATLAPGVADAAMADAGRPLSAELTGAAEAPGPGDPDGSGTASLRVNPGQREICYTLTVANVDNVTAAHIHIGPAGSPGPVVVPLAAPVGGSVSACVAVDRDLALAILTEPAAYYVNVHSSGFPAGAVRGQLHR